MRRAALLLTLAIAAMVSHAQNTNYFGLFPTIDHSGDISKKFSYNAYLFDAIKLDGSDDATLPADGSSFYIYGELGLSYQLTPRLSATAAYVHERQHPFTDSYRTENRLFQQLTLKLPIGKSELKQRLRFDERFIQDRVTGDAPLTTRLRYLIGVKYPANTKVYFTGYTEAFFNTSNDFTYEENWAALQGGLKLNDANAIEAGLLLVNWKLSEGWLNQYYLQLTWVSHIDRKS